MDLKKLKICWNHSRKKVDEYCQSLNDLISNNADLNEMEDCFVILENKVEELSLIDRQILKLVDESEMENQLKEIDIYKNKWLTTSKKYRDFKQQTSSGRSSLAQDSASQSNLQEFQTEYQMLEILIQQLLEEMTDLKEEFDNFNDDFTKYQKFFDGNIAQQTVDDIKTRIRNLLQTNIDRTIDQYRSGNLDSNKFRKLFAEHKKEIVSIRKTIAVQESAMKKEFEDQEAYLSKDIINLDENDSLEEVVFQKQNLDSFVLYWISGYSTTNKVFNCFMAMADNRRDNEQYVIVEYKDDSGNLLDDKIVHYKGKEIIKIIRESPDNKEEIKKSKKATDLLSFVKLKDEKNFRSTANSNTPSTPFELRCPGGCKKELLTWNCSVCTEVITQRVDRKIGKTYLFCRCGWVKSRSVLFKCNSRNHGDSYLPINYLFRDVEDTPVNTKKIPPKEELNILLLGRSGVGKSTWINGLANYSEYETLDEAEKKGSKYVIPASFSVTYQNNGKSETQVVKIGEDDINENTAVGISATRKPKSYLFRAKDRIVRLIDTPGLGDTDGIYKDRQNIKDILDHISIYDNIHGICILLKSNETRIEAIFRYCTTEILLHLHRSAAKNILFCFTNSRASFYHGGDTIPVLAELLQELELNDLIQVKTNTMFNLDNEAFRYLCTLKYPQIPTSKEQKKVFKESWTKSVEETRRLFRTVANLEPHKVADTTTLCNTRKRILNLWRPIGDITQNIQLNVKKLQEKLNENRESIKNCNEGYEELEKKLRIPRIVLVPEPLGHGRMVCTNSKCTESFYLLDSAEYKQTEYTQICHEYCYLQHFPPDAVTHENVRRCQIFNYDKERKECVKCGCIWHHHMYITYSQKRVQKYITDPNISKKIQDIETAKKEINKHKKQLEKEIEVHKKEENVLVKTASNFAVFLKKCSIVTYNDSLEKYLQYLIDQESSRGNEDHAAKLRSTLGEYKNEIEELQNVLEKSEIEDSRKSDFLTPEYMTELEQNLYKLELNGEQLKKISDVAATSYESARKKTDVWLTENVFSF